jgi:hypothetical protein
MKSSQMVGFSNFIFSLRTHNVYPPGRAEFEITQLQQLLIKKWLRPAIWLLFIGNFGILTHYQRGTWNAELWAAGSFAVSYANSGRPGGIGTPRLAVRPGLLCSLYNQACYAVYHGNQYPG